MGKNLYEETKKQMDEELEKVKKAAEKCSPEMKAYIQSTLGDESNNYMQKSYDFSMQSLKDTVYIYENMSEEVQKEQIEANAFYKRAREVVDTLRYMVGLTNDIKKLSKDCMNRDGSIRDFFMPEELSKYREAGEKNNRLEHSFLEEKLLEMQVEIAWARQRAEECSPELREVLRAALDPQNGEYADVQKELEQCEKVRGLSDSFRDIVNDKGYQHAFRYVETVKYLTGQEVDEEHLLEEIGGKKLEELEKYRQVEVLHNKMKDAELENRAIWQRKLNPMSVNDRELLADLKGKSKQYFWGNPALGVKYPAVNPKYKSSVKQAELSERLARIHEAAQLRPKAIRKLIKEFEYSSMFKETKIKMDDQYNKLYQNPAEMMSKEEYKKEVKKLDEQVKEKGFEQVIETMEYLAGIRPELNENTRARMEKYAKPKTDEKENRKKVTVPELPEKGSELEIERNKVLKPWEIKRLDINFENMDDMLTNMELAVAKSKENSKLKYKEISENVLKNGKVNDQAAELYLGLYFEATANRLLDPLYQEFETKNTSINRTALISVNGKTVKNIMLDKMGREAFNNMSREERNRQASLIVAAGLQSGKRVEAFLPQEDGKVSGYPVAIGMTGCDVKKLEKVNDGIIMKILYKIGDLFHLTHRGEKKEEYQNILAAREEIRQSLENRGIMDKTKAPDEYERELMGEEKTAENAIENNEIEINL